MERIADSVQVAKSQNKELQQNHTTIVVRIFSVEMRVTRFWILEFGFWIERITDILPILL